MINTQLIEHTVRLAIHTTGIAKEKSVSLVILAPTEHGKSEILKKFAFVPSVKIATDFNSFQFADYANEYQAGLKRTIVIPDFLRIIKRKYSTAANALSIISAITEEGWVGKLPLGQTVNQPIRANVLTALTESEIKDRRHKWAQMGFLSRFVPISYSYLNKTKDKIRGYIRDRLYSKDAPFNFELSKEKTEIAITPQVAQKVQDISLGISKVNNFTGFRLQRQLQTLTLANALVSKRTLTTDDDYKVIKKISELINFEFNPL